MIVRLGHDTSVVLLDIEGTTTPIAFVHDVLFSYARARLDRWLAAHRVSPDASGLIDALEIEHAVDRARGEDVPAWSAREASDREHAAVRYLHWLMDRDRKSPALKRLQGLIWDDGYRSGELRGELFPDVAPAIRRWRADGRAVAIYSSGSELAQRRLFASAADGDLTPLLDGFFDTRVGAKADAESYVRIAAALDVASHAMLFVSDVARELDAAAAAGCRVALSVRPGNAPPPKTGAYPQIHTFDEIV